MFLKSSVIPKTRFGDKLVCYFRFIKKHKRFPRKEGFNDVLFNIKITDEICLPERQFISDKEYVKYFIGACVGNDFNIPTKAILKNENEILCYEYQKNDVIKPTHASGLVDIISNASDINKKKYLEWLKVDYYMISREYNYRWLNKKIIVEPLVFGQKNINDIKFFCLHGSVRFIQVDVDRNIQHRRNIYDKDWNNLKVSLCYPLSEKIIQKPKHLKDMIYLAEKLSASFSSLRVDMYYDENSGKLARGELTNCHGSAHEKFASTDQENTINQLFK